ncbi:MAG: DUF4105 domain-containing protein, partial [Deltaproteobacteria bacterium]
MGTVGGCYDGGPVGWILTFLVGVGISLSSSFALETENTVILERVAQSPYWLRLLRYEKSLWGGHTSRVDGDEFFFSPEGKKNPLSELKATVLAFSKNIEVGKLKQHPQCAFPERYRYLKKQLHLKIQDVACPKLDEYLAKFNPESVTLVFSSAYPHNPGSMFGHTFLRINSKSKDQKKQDLLDWGISYAAQVADDENALAFVYLGLTGGYRGQFSLLPYYAKVNDYINNESRDLWEYELNINEEETYRLLRNVWEVETNSHFDYYFLDENCAFELLAFLEVAKPDWNLTSFPIYVIPGETIKKLAGVPGAVKTIRFRPSLQKKVMVEFEKLTDTQKQTFENLINYRVMPDNILESVVLERAADYLLYVKKKNENELDKEQQKLLRSVLVRRSELGSSPASTELSEAIRSDSRPDLAHDTYKIGLASGVEFRKWGEPVSQYFQELQFKFAFHDLLNSDAGYTPFSQLDFPAVTLRFYDQSQKVKLETVHLLSLTSLSPLTQIEKYPSWTFHMEVLSPKDLQCDHCQVFHFDIGSGVTLGAGY